MSEHQSTTLTTPPGEQKRKKKRRFGAWLLRLIIAASVVLGSAFLFTLTPAFKSWLLGYLLETANSEFVGTIEASQLQGNVLAGIDLQGVSIHLDGDTLLHSPTLSVQYNVEPFFDDIISVRQIALLSPSIRMVKNTEGTWLHDAIFAPKIPSTDSTTQPFAYKVLLQNLTIANGTLFVRNKQCVGDCLRPRGRVDFDSLLLQDVALSLSAEIDIASESHAIEIQHFSCRDEHSGLDLKRLRMKAAVDTNSLRLPLLEIATADSDLRLYAELFDVNVLAGLGPNEWQETPAFINLTGPRIASHDLQRFLPELDFMAGTVGLELNAAGSYGDLDINQLHLDLKDSHIEISGKLKNLHNTEDLFIDAWIENTTLSYQDVQDHVPGLHITDLSYLGRVDLQFASFYGEPQEFVAALAADTKAGRIDAQATLNTAGSKLKYEASVEFTNSNLGPVVKNSDMAGRLNGVVYLNGAGTSLDELSTEFYVDTYNSRLGEYQWRNSSVSGRVDSSGLVLLDTTYFRWQLPQELSMSDTVEYSELTAFGAIDLRNTKTPRYTIEAVFDKLNIARLAPGSGLRSALSGKASIQGQGVHPDSLESDIVMDIDEALLPGKSIQPFELDVSIKRDGNSRSLVLESLDKITDTKNEIELTGVYTLDGISSVASSYAEQLSGNFARKVNELSDNLPEQFQFEADEELLDTSIIQTTIPVDVTLKVRSYDLSPLAVFLPGVSLQGEILLNSSLQRDSLGSQLHVDSSYVRGLSFISADSFIEADSIALVASITDGWSSETQLQSTLGIRIPGQSVFNDYLLDSCSVELLTVSDSLQLDVGIALNEVGNIRTKGSIRETEGVYNINLEKVSLGNNQFRWQNASPLALRVEPGALYVDEFSFVRSDHESIALSGELRGDTLRNVLVRVENFDLASINSFLPETDEVEPLNYLTGTLDSLSVSLAGTLQDPQVLLAYHSSNVTFSQTMLGSKHVQLAYADSLLTGVVDIKHPDMTEAIFGADVRKLPLQLSFTDGIGLIEDGDVDVGIEAEDVPFKALQPFVPAASVSKGRVHLGLDIVGQYNRNVDYIGQAGVKDGHITVLPTGLSYHINGDMRIRDSLVYIDSVRLQNESRDIKDTAFGNGVALVTGSLKIHVFDIKYFDLFARTPQWYSRGGNTKLPVVFKVMNNNSRVYSPTIYGDILIRTPYLPMRFFGTIDEPHLSGDVLVQSASLFFPETRKVSRADKSVCYEILAPDEDGNMVVVESNCPENETVPKNGEKVAGYDILSRNVGFADRIVYDVNIDIANEIRVQMDFGQLDRFEGNVSLIDRNNPLHYTTDLRDDSRPRRLVGELGFRNGLYQFYRNFSADGTIRWDGPIDDPILELTANFSSFRSTAEVQQKYSVQLDMLGRKSDSLSVDFRYQIADGSWEEDDKNALLLLILGQTEDELKGIPQAAINSTLQQFSQVVSRGLSDLLEGTGIQAVEVYVPDLSSNSDDSSLENAIVKVRGSIEGTGVSYSASTYINDVSAATFTVDIPLAALLDREGLEQLYLTLVMATASEKTESFDQKDIEIKLNWQSRF